MAMMRMVKLTQMQVFSLRQMLRILLTRTLRSVAESARKPEIPVSEVALHVMTASNIYIDLDIGLLSLWAILRAQQQLDGYLPATKQRHSTYLEIASRPYGPEDYPNTNPEVTETALAPILAEQQGLIAAFNDAAWIDENDLPRGSRQINLVVNQQGSNMVN